jgi:hypothetical protein
VLGKKVHPDLKVLRDRKVLRVILDLQAKLVQLLR